MIRRKLRSPNNGLLAVAIALTAPAWAVSLSQVDDAQPPPRSDVNTAALAAAESWTAGSASLVPLMAADMQANRSSTIDAPAERGGAPAIGKPLDDIAFVRVATENGRKEADSARDALPRLKAPELRRIAESLVTEHDRANARLSQLAEAKQWPVPPPSLPAAPPVGSASSDFDARWTAEMIAGHERSVDMYRAQASGGEDKELRKYARDTLPAIEQHLTQLKGLQK
jgi:putative membrane protein